MSAQSSDTALAQWMGETRAWAERALVALLDEFQRRADEVGALGALDLSAALRYAALGGGKRVRPALVRLACTELGGSDAAAAPYAVAVELIHAYSLVHDDLPCMDDDDLRRGRPTVHRAWNEATAVLVGDGLQSLAFEHLARRGGQRAAEAVVILARAAGPLGMVGGQALDLAAEETPTDLDGTLTIHRLKTAALLAASAELGGLAAGAGRGARESARRFGVQLGLLFQVVDDLLDVTGDAASLGKTPGKDAASDKGTIVAALGFERAERYADELAAGAVEAARAACLDGAGLASALVGRVRRRTS